MPDQILAARPALPWMDDHGNTVVIFDNRIHVHLETTDLSATDALDLSAALACAVTTAAEYRITNPNHTTTAR